MKAFFAIISVLISIGILSICHQISMESRIFIQGQKRYIRALDRVNSFLETNDIILTSSKGGITYKMGILTKDKSKYL